MLNWFAIKWILLLWIFRLECNPTTQATGYHERPCLLHGARKRNKKISALVQESPQVTAYHLSLPVHLCYFNLNPSSFQMSWKVSFLIMNYTFCAMQVVHTYTTSCVVLNPYCGHPHVICVTLFILFLWINNAASNDHNLPGQSYSTCNDCKVRGWGSGVAICWWLFSVVS